MPTLRETIKYLERLTFVHGEDILVEQIEFNGVELSELTVQADKKSIHIWYSSED